MRSYTLIVAAVSVFLSMAVAAPIAAPIAEPAPEASPAQTSVSHEFFLEAPVLKQTKVNANHPATVCVYLLNLMGLANYDDYGSSCP